MEEIKNKTLLELQEMAKSMGIKGYSKFKKAELIKLIEENTPQEPKEEIPEICEETKDDDIKEEVTGIVDVLADGFGFLRGENYLSTSKDVYVSPMQIKRFNLKTGDKVTGLARQTKGEEKNKPLIYVKTVNGEMPFNAIKRKPFEYLIPVYPDERIYLETENDKSMRLIDLLAPFGKGQRGLIVAPPKAGKTTLLKKIANSVTENFPKAELIVLLIDERPEEVTDMKRSVKGDVIYSTFDEPAEHHIRVAEMVFERAQRLAEQKQDVVILLDSLTRLTRSYNLVIPSGGRTLSGGIDPNAFYGPKKFFGAARNIENGGSVTILATALIETGSRMDEVIFEEFKGTGNMEIHLNRELQEKRIFPAIDINKTGTRKEELLMTEEELTAMWSIRRALNKKPQIEVCEKLLTMIEKTPDNKTLIKALNKE